MTCPNVKKQSRPDWEVKTQRGPKDQKYRKDWTSSLNNTYRHAYQIQQDPKAQRPRFR